MLTETRSFISDAPSRPRSSADAGPTFARPSESSTMRWMYFPSRFFRISAAPWLTPPKSAVLPREVIARMRDSIHSMFRAGCAGTMVSTSWS